MRNRSDEQNPPRQEDRDRQPAESDADEARNFESEVSSISTDDEGSFFRDSTTINEAEIDTHGSER